MATKDSAKAKIAQVAKLELRLADLRNLINGMPDIPIKFAILGEFNVLTDDEHFGLPAFYMRQEFSKGEWANAVANGNAAIKFYNEKIAPFLSSKVEPALRASAGAPTPISPVEPGIVLGPGAEIMPVPKKKPAVGKGFWIVTAVLGLGVFMSARK